MDEELNAQTFNYDTYKQRETRWIAVDGEWKPNYHAQSNGAVYLRNLPYLNRKLLKKTGLYEFVKQVKQVDPEYYLAYTKYGPELERMVKAGLGPLVADSFRHGGIPELTQDRNMGVALGIDGQLFKRLRAKKGGREYLDWLRLIKDTKKRFRIR